ncbi:MAG: carbohydrate-binding family 9-like protein, partial [Planctomycetaceae bacterium]|nr:carbohydrate-binding family 9-like protein [Planctomycetaceae bacterium]
HGSLRELQTGRAPSYGTTFKAAWGEDGNLYFAIRCDEPAGGKLNIGTTRREDQAIWYGDVVEILLETDSHSYYQLAVNPAGALIDLDRGAARSAWFGWDSQAEVATQIADDHWTVEIRIPVVQDENDPLHQVVGRKPSSSLPWHFNVCRQRIRDNGSELSAFSPTGTSAFHKTLKFGQLYEGRSHRFDHADDEVDFLSQSREAAQLRRQGKLDEALAAWTSLASGELPDLKLTDLQKSFALEQAAECARSLRQPDRAAELAEAAPLAAVAKTIRMENLLAQRKLTELFEQFGEEDFSAWPFWKAGEGYALRGQAHSLAGQGKQAEADFLQALELTTDRQARDNLWLATGANRYHNLKDAEQALAAYRHIVERAKNNFGATAFRAVQHTASILREQKKYDESLATLHIYELPELRGYWRGALYRTLADTLKAAGKQKDAEAAYGEVLKEKGSSKSDRQAAEEALKAGAN